MRYPFPEIKNISDVLPHINDSFYVAKKDGYTVVNYVINSPEVFPAVYDPSYNLSAAIRRECRGLIFDSESGDIIARRFHKFFNLNERLETASENMPDKFELRGFEKLDGSMITPIYLKEGIRWGTKNGLTDVALQAEEFVANNPKYQDFAAFCKAEKCTPIFEWCSRKQKIVVDHPVDRLVLLDIRQMVTGAYMPRSVIEYLAFKFDIECVQPMELTAAEVAERDDIEGIVLQYLDGHRVKVKSSWYLQLHRAKEAVTRFHDVLMLIIDNKLDDLKPLLSPEDLLTVETLEKEFWAHANSATDKVIALHNKALSMSRKDFAIQQNTSQEANRQHTAMVFKLLDKKDHFEYFDFVVNTVKSTPHSSNADFYSRVSKLLEWTPKFGEKNAHIDA